MTDIVGNGAIPKVIDGPPPTPAMRTIIEAAAIAFDVSIFEMYSTRRHPRLTRARHVAWWLARRLTTMSFPEIGMAIGGRDHSSVVCGCQILDRDLKADPEIWRDVIAVQDAVGKSMPAGWIETYGIAAPPFMEAAE